MLHLAKLCFSFGEFLSLLGKGTLLVVSKYRGFVFMDALREVDVAGLGFSVKKTVNFIRFFLGFSNYKYVDISKGHCLSYGRKSDFVSTYRQVVSVGGLHLVSNYAKAYLMLKPISSYRNVGLISWTPARLLRVGGKLMR